MKCQHCEFENREPANYCANCGNKLEKILEVEEESLQDIQNSVVGKEELAKDNEEGVTQEETIIEVKDDGTEDGSDKDEKNSVDKEMELLEDMVDSKDGEAHLNQIDLVVEKPVSVNKKLFTVVGASIVIICLLITVMINYSNRRAFPVNLKNAPVAFTTDNESYIKEYGKKAIKLNSHIDDNNILTKNGKDYFFLSGQRLYHYSKGELYKIDKEVHSYSIADDGTSAIYLSDFDVITGKGELYYYSMGNSENIDDEVNNFALSEDGNMVAYIKEFQFNEGGKLYLHERGGETTRIEKDVKRIVKVLDNGGTFYIDEDNALFYLKGSSRERIAKDVEDCIVTQKGDKLAWIDKEGDLFTKLGDKEEKKVDKNVENIHLRNVKKNKLDLLYWKKDNLYLFMEDAKNDHKIDDSYNFNLAMFEDIYAYEDDGELFICEYKGGKWRESQITTEEDVVSVFISPFGNYISYIDINDKLYYWDGESKIVDEEIGNIGTTIQIVLSPYDDAILYIDEEQILRQSVNGQKGEEVAKDIKYFWTNDYKRIFAINKNNQLLEFTIGKEQKLIEEEIKKFIHINYGSN